LILKGFNTEKERLEQYLKSKEIDHYYNSLSQSEEPKTRTPTGILIQPHMKFKARTDIERVADAVNNYHYGSADKGIVQRQLKNLSLNVAKVASNDKNKRKNSNESINNKSMISKSQETRRRRKSFIDIKQELNSEAKYLLKDYHPKTHFKAIRVLANNCNGKFIIKIGLSKPPLDTHDTPKRTKIPKTLLRYPFQECDLPIELSEDHHNTHHNLSRCESERPIPDDYLLNYNPLKKAKAKRTEEHFDKKSDRMKLMKEIIDKEELNRNLLYNTYRRRNTSGNNLKVLDMSEEHGRRSKTNFLI
jgi:hypothetical protein